MLFGLSIHLFDFIGLFCFLAGLIVGLGAVTVIDIHGFLGRTSSYWTEATTRTHKVTKPLIWVGIFLGILGGIFLYRNEPFWGIPAIHSVLAMLLLFNGFFLSFVVSPYMIDREKKGKQKELLPKSWQIKIAISLIFSDIGWWGSVFFLTLFLLQR
jgi:hypothetical protein